MRSTITEATALSVVLIAVGLAAAAPAPVDPNDYTESPALWTCGAQEWAPLYATCTGTPDKPAAGKHAIVLNYPGEMQYYLAFPKFRNANWDLSGAAYLEFQVKFPKGETWDPVLYLRSADGPFVRITRTGGPAMYKESEGQWQPVRIPLTPDKDWAQFAWLGGSLKRVDFLEIAFGGSRAPRYASHYIVVDDVHFGPQQPKYTPPDDHAADLDVLVIERTPTYERYDPNYDNGRDVAECKNKAAKHYPDAGEEVTFTASVQNKGRAPAGGKFVWLLDGKEVGRGDVATLKSREKTTFAIKWPWDAGDHDLTFKLTPAGDDLCARNNELTIRTNALLLKYVIERGTQTRFEEKPNVIGSYSLEDWPQAQARFMNQLFAESKYDFAPNGIGTRVMVGRFEYVDDGYLDERCPGGPFQVGEQDPNYDGGRGCTETDTFWNSGEQSACYLNFENLRGRPDDCWLHEMSHQIGIIDDYQFITEPGDNAVNGVGFNYDQRGLMGGGEITPFVSPGTLYSLYAPGDVQGMNATKGKRRGYYGEYLFCLPKQCALVIRDADGKPIADAEIKVYQTKDRKLDTTPEHAGRTDTQGRFPLPNRPVKGGMTETGCELRDNPFGPINVVGLNGLFLVVVKSEDGKEQYGFTTVQDFNVAWAAGQRDSADITVVVKVKGDERVWTAALVKKASAASK
jgi:hypothetical protein